MTGKIRHLVNRSGRYHARLVVPKDLRGIVGKTELRSPLGADYRQAMKLLPGAVAQLQHKIAVAERSAGQGRPSDAPARYPLAPDQLAHSHYQQRLAFDEMLRNDSRYAQTGIDDMLVNRLREAIAGRASNEELHDLVGDQIERFRAAGNLTAGQGSDEWRVIARALCIAEYEALERVAERDEGDYTGTVKAPIIRDVQPAPEPQRQLSLKRLWTDYVAIRQQAGFMRDGGRRQAVAVESLRKFLKHDDARKITKRDMLEWRDHLMQTLEAKTVSDVHLSTIRTLLGWAVENDHLPSNPVANVKQRKPRKVYNRERGYTDDEAVTILKASRAYQPKADKLGRVRELPNLVAAKRWVPMICAFTGARVTEITQLRKEDFRNMGGQWLVRITADAGSVKAGDYRDAPLHAQLIAEGFVDFLESAGEGPLFHNGVGSENFIRKSKQISNQLGDWLRKTGLRTVGLPPNHAWRHRFKTQCLELGISGRVMDAIQGHSPKTAGDGYGDVTIKKRVDAISRLPEYRL